MEQCMTYRRFLHHLKRGNLSFIGRLIYTPLVKSELLLIRFRDGREAFSDTHLVDEKLTAVIKTFERPATLVRLVDSIKRFYPNMKIIVVDDSREPSQLDGVTTIVMPYNSGVSAGRNRGLLEVKTKYLMLLDDDFIFYRQTDLRRAIELMDKNEEIDIMGGEVVNLPQFKADDFRNAGLHPSDAVSTMPPGSEIDGLPVYDKVANFFIAHPKRLRLVGWDERLKRLDHADFFTRAKGVLTTVFNHSFKVLHAQTPFDREYMKKRDDMDQDHAILYDKYYKQIND